MDAHFIHLSTEDQLDKILEKYWKGVSEYIILKLKVAELQGKLVLEANPGGANKYYHLYGGGIPMSSIQKIIKGKKSEPFFNSSL